MYSFTPQACSEVQTVFPYSSIREWQYLGILFSIQVYLTNMAVPDQITRYTTGCVAQNKQVLKLKISLTKP